MSDVIQWQGIIFLLLLLLGENYYIWAIKMKAYLKGRSLWEVVENDVIHAAVTPQTRGSVDYPSTRGIQVDVGLPDATSENRAESPLYGELYPNTILVYNLHLPVPNNPIYAIYIKYGHLGP